MRRTSATLTALLIAATMAVVFAGGCRSTQPAKVQMEDSEITTQIKAKMVADPLVAAIQVGVTTNEGVVTLTGRVKTQAEKEQAEKIARGTEGVKKVVNLVKVGEMPKNPNG